ENVMSPDHSLAQTRPRGSTLVLSLLWTLQAATPVWSGEKPNHAAEPVASVNMLDSAPTAVGDKNVNGVPVFTTIREYVNPKHVAVMVVDMQNEIVSTEGGYWRKDRSLPANPDAHRIEPSYQELVEDIRRFLEEARRQGIPIIYTEYIHRDANGK